MVFGLHNCTELTLDGHGAADGDLGGVALALALVAAQPLIHGDEAQAGQPLPPRLEVLPEVRLRRRRRHHRGRGLVTRPAKQRNVKYDKSQCKKGLNRILAARRSQYTWDLPLISANAEVQSTCDAQTQTQPEVPLQMSVFTLDASKLHKNCLQICVLASSVDWA